MKFSMHDFVLKGIIAAIGVQSDYWVILEAARWYEKGVLLEEDLEEIQRLIDEKNTPEPIVDTEPETESIEEEIESGEE